MWHSKISTCFYFIRDRDMNKADCCEALKNEEPKSQLLGYKTLTLLQLTLKS